MKEYGLDLSTWNGTLDFNEIKKAGHTFVILRAGYGTSAKDNRFEEYYAAAKKVGLKVGAYWYSYALNTDGAKAEAKKMLEVIKGKTFEYPIFIDMEDADQYKKKHGMPSNSTLCSICNTFCEYIENKGYYVGIYASESWFNNQLKNVSKAYDKWVANWGSNNGSLNSDKSGSYHLHQYTSMYKIGSKRFDKNISYFDYSSTIKNAGLNGFSKSSTEEKPTSSTIKNDLSSYSTLELVVGVMQGKYGLGDERKNKLGSRYNEVQNMINHIASANVSTLVNEVKAGKYGNGDTRKIVLGNRYKEVQDKINNEKTSIKKGSTVKIKKGAKDLNTKSQYASWVYSSSFKVIEVSGTRVVFGNSKGQVTGVVDISNCY